MYYFSGNAKTHDKITTLDPFKSTLTNKSFYLSCPNMCNNYTALVLVWTNALLHNRNLSHTQYFTPSCKHVMCRRTKCITHSYKVMYGVFIIICANPFVIFMWFKSSLYSLLVQCLLFTTHGRSLLVHCKYLNLYFSAALNKILLFYFTVHSITKSYIVMLYFCKTLFVHCYTLTRTLNIIIYGIKRLCPTW